MSKPVFYECGICGFFHPQEWDGDCARQTYIRLCPEDLDEAYGEGEWIEVDPPENAIAPEPEYEEPVRHKNLDRVMALTATTDLNGAIIEHGCKIRVFCGMYDAVNDRLCGIQMIGRGIYYVDGILQEIGNIPDEKGRYYYKIRTETVTQSRIIRTNNNHEITDHTYTDVWLTTIDIPVNGTPVEPFGEALGWNTFAVFRRTPEFS